MVKELRKIYKLVLEKKTGEQIVNIEGFCSILNYAIQEDKIVIWYTYIKSLGSVTKKFIIAFTGYEVVNECNYLGTLTDSRGLVYHIFVE